MSILRVDKIAGLESVNAITGSVKFSSGNGANQGTYLEVYDPDRDFNLGTTDFSIEFWMYPNTTDTSTQENDLACILDYGYDTSGNTSGAHFALHQDDAKLSFGFNNATQLETSDFLTANTWHHIAVQKHGGFTRIYGDGTQVGSVADTQDYTDALFRTLQIGSQAASGVERNFDGYISCVRICKGHVIYKKAFTPPTRQLTVHDGPSDNKTVLFCCHSSQDPLREETGKDIVIGTKSGTPGPVATTFTPDVGNDHTHGTVLEGGTAFNSLNYLTLPRGTTAQRANSRGRAVIAGGYNPTNSPVASRSINTIEYIEINTTGHAKDFGDLSYGSASGGTCSSSTRAVTGGSYVAPSITGSLNTMSYFTIATLGDGTNFGDLTVARGYVSSLSSDTRGIWAGGAGGPSSPYIQSDVSVTDYVTIASEGNATSFGELIDQGYMADVACSSPTRGVIAGGNPATNVIQYVTIASTGIAKDFGDLTAANAAPAAASSHTRAVFCGSSPGAPAYTPLNHIDYVTIATTGNANDFGDALYAGYYKTGTSNSIRAVWTGTYQTPAKLNTIEYAQIQTLGNTVDFGDSTMTYSNRAGATSDTHGGLA